MTGSSSSVIQSKLVDRHVISERVAQFFFLALAGFSMTVFFWKNWKNYQTPYDHSFFSRIYSLSPYVMGPAASEGIGDDGLYAFAGYYYIYGGDISQVNFENPPIGKYLIGLSIQLFGNQNRINIVYGFLFLLTLYFLCKLLFSRGFWGCLAVCIACLDPYFQSQLLLSLLDLPMTVFFLIGFTFYLIAKRKNYWFFLFSSVFFGLSAGTKFFPGLILFILALIIDLLFSAPEKLPKFIISLILIPVIYFIVHGVYFLYHPSLLEFFHYQKWIVHWRLGNPTVPGNIITNVLFGFYRSWWEKGIWIFDKEWSPILAVLTVFGLSSPILAPNSKWFLFYWLTIVFIIYIAFGTVGVAKYIFPVYAFLLILFLRVIMISSGRLLDVKYHP